MATACHHGSSWYTLFATAHPIPFLYFPSGPSSSLLRPSTSFFSLSISYFLTYLLVYVAGGMLSGLAAANGLPELIATLDILRSGLEGELLFLLLS